MDTSETYIKVCEKAEEIQEHWEPEKWDFFYIRSFKSVNPKLIWSMADFEDGCIYTFDGWNKDRDYIWLPRQGQLQEMLIAIITSDSLNISAHLCKFVVANERYCNEYFNCSMEQLWLAFVMHELHQKKWTGTEWQSQD